MFDFLKKKEHPMHKQVKQQKRREKEQFKQQLKKEYDKELHKHQLVAMKQKAKRDAYKKVNQGRFGGDFLGAMKTMNEGTKGLTNLIGSPSSLGYQGDPLAIGPQKKVKKKKKQRQDDYSLII